MSDNISEVLDADISMVGNYSYNSGSICVLDKNGKKLYIDSVTDSDSGQVFKTGNLGNAKNLKPLIDTHIVEFEPRSFVYTVDSFTKDGNTNCVAVSRSVVRLNFLNDDKLLVHFGEEGIKEMTAQELSTLLPEKALHRNLSENNWFDDKMLLKIDSKSKHSDPFFNIKSCGGKEYKCFVPWEQLGITYESDSVDKNITNIARLSDKYDYIGVPVDFGKKYNLRIVDNDGNEKRSTDSIASLTGGCMNVCVDYQITNREFDLCRAVKSGSLFGNRVSQSGAVAKYLEAGLANAEVDNFKRCYSDARVSDLLSCDKKQKNLSIEDRAHNVQLSFSKFCKKNDINDDVRLNTYRELNNMRLQKDYPEFAEYIPNMIKTGVGDTSVDTPNV